ICLSCLLFAPLFWCRKVNDGTDWELVRPADSSRLRDTFVHFLVPSCLDECPERFLGRKSFEQKIFSQMFTEKKELSHAESTLE
ncbi:MAG: hypothetical protein KDA78_18630, partial [Planctomycetaceae bacterium]|nr:hypothetical protein [Planctomycetaceae bacterium]